MSTIDLTGDGHGHHVSGTPMVYKHGWVPIAAASFKETGGFSINARGEGPKGGYMVSLSKGEASFPEAQFRQNPEHFIDQHASANAKALKAPDNYHGAWTDNGHVYLDVSHNHADVRSAADAALRNKQLAVADVAKMHAEDWQHAFPSTRDVTEQAIRSLSAKEEGIALGSRHVSKVGRGYTVDQPGGLPIRFNTPRQAADYIANLPEHRHKEAAAVNLSYTTPTLRTTDYDLSSKGGQLAFWKQILPMKSIHYTARDGSRQSINFDKDYLTDLANNKAVDKIGFLLADRDNAHTMDPERWRGEVVKMEVRDDGLYGKIVFPSPEAAKAVLENPDLGVSARIREGIQKSDGSTLNRGIIHVLGTLDPQVSGMSPWQTADLSTEQGDVLDLSDKEYEDMADDSKKTLADYTEADIEKMTDAELDAFLAEFVPEFDNYTGDTDEADEHDDEADEDHEDHEDEADEAKVLTGAGADMSKSGTSDIELANQQVAAANARATEALKRVAEAEWRETRAAYLSDGVPPHALDLAAPVLNRPDDMVIDLSVTDEADVNVSEVVRGLLDSMKGFVDLSAEEGHNGHFDLSNGEDPDKELLDRWDEQF